MTEDMTLKDDLLEELDFEPSVDAAHIGVTVNDGVVCLTGHVISLQEKAKAEEAVWRVTGVRGLAQELEVRPPAAKTFDDESIARHALDYLVGSSQIPDDAVHVKVQQGWVTLSGELEWQYQKTIVGDVVRALRGVRGIDNNIRLAPRANVDDIKKLIQKALHRHAEVEAVGVDITVEDGRVVLEGQVDSRLERSQIKQAAWSAPGVHEVVDHMMS